MRSQSGDGECSLASMVPAAQEGQDGVCGHGRNGDALVKVMQAVARGALRPWVHLAWGMGPPGVGLGAAGLTQPGSKCLGLVGQMLPLQLLSPALCRAARDMT